MKQNTQLEPCKAKPTSSWVQQADRCTAPAHQGRKMPQRVLQQRLPSPVAPGLLPRRTSQGSRPTFRVRVAPLTIVKHPNRLQPTFRSL